MSLIVVGVFAHISRAILIIIVMLRTCSCTFIVKITSPSIWTPDKISDLIDGVNKFGTDWKKIKNEYDYTVTIKALQSKWYSVIRRQCQLEDGKWKMAQQESLGKTRGREIKVVKLYTLGGIGYNMVCES